MINFFKKIVDKEFEKISWGKIKFKIGNIFEKKYVDRSKIKFLQTPSSILSVKIKSSIIKLKN